MKYYIYISDTKVDMLYPQIPKPLLKKIASSLNIDLKFLGAELSVGAKGNPSDETRYAKVQIVSEYIEKHLDVGSVDAPSTYFKGTLAMKYKFLESTYKKTGAVFFGGTTESKFIGLGGSMHHLIGSNPESLRIQSYSPLFFLLNILAKDAKTNVNTKVEDYPPDDFSWITHLITAVTTMKTPSQRFEFLAKTLIQGSVNSSMSFSQSYAVLGTPIYVAIDD